MSESHNLQERKQKEIKGEEDKREISEEDKLIYQYQINGYETRKWGKTSRVKIGGKWVGLKNIKGMNALKRKVYKKDNHTFINIDKFYKLMKKNNFESKLSEHQFTDNLDLDLYQKNLFNNVNNNVELLCGGILYLIDIEIKSLEERGIKSSNIEFLPTMTGRMISGDIGGEPISYTFGSFGISALYSADSKIKPNTITNYFKPKDKKANEIILDLNKKLKDGKFVDDTFNHKHRNYFNERKSYKKRDILSVYNDIMAKLKGFESAQLLQIDRVGIRVLVAKVGGCDSKTHNQHSDVSIGKFMIARNPASTKNNCFFKCMSLNGDIKNPTLTQCNDWRNKVGLEKNVEVPIHKIGELTKVMNIQKPNVVDENEKVLISGECKTTLIHKDNHFMLLKSKKTKCPKCGEMFVNISNHSSESCSKTAIRNEKFKKRGGWNNYSKREEDGTMLLRKPKELKREVNVEKLKLDAKRSIIHYDIETKLNKDNGPNNNINTGKFTAVLIGVMYYEKPQDGEWRKKYIMFKNMDDFLVFLKSDSVKHCNVLNAFNGKSFDHYFLVNQYAIKEGNGLKNLELMIHNSCIIGGEVYGKKLWDVSKHTEGSLDDNLKSIGAKTQKLKFDYDKIDEWDKMEEKLRDELAEYLKADVEGMVEFTEKMLDANYDDTGIIMTEMISTPQMCYEAFKKRFMDENHNIYTPNLEQFNNWSKSIYGGKTIAYKERFESKDMIDLERFNKYSKIEDENGNPVCIGGESVYDDCKDFLLDLDGVSLYPSAMMCKYPIGKAIDTNEYKEDKLGIYLTKFKRVKDLYYPVLPYKDENGALLWHQSEGEGYYTSVDIEEAKKYGYQFEIIKGHYWESSANIFNEYIEYYFKKKSNSKKGSVEYLLSKLRMNSLYGKMIQRAIFDKMEVFDSTEKMWESVLCKDRYITELIEFGRELIVKSVSYIEEEKTKCITKPTQLGAFILSYSRQIMNNFHFKMNPDNDYEKHPYYGDTDSLIEHCKFTSPSIMGKELGQMDYDLKSKYGPAKIIRYLGPAPKTYLCDYLVLEDIVKSSGKILKDGENYNEDDILRRQTIVKRHIRCKGIGRAAITKNYINFESYDKLLKGEKVLVPSDNENFQFKKVHYKTNIIGKTKDKARNMSEEEKLRIIEDSKREIMFTITKLCPEKILNKKVKQDIGV